MNSYGELPSPRDPFDNAPRFDLFGAFTFLAVLILFGAAYVGLYAGPFVQTSKFELPDIFGTKAQETAQKLLVSVAIPNSSAGSQVEPTATVGPSAIVPVVPGEASEAAITVPFGIGAQAAAAAAPAAATAPAAPAPAPTSVTPPSAHAVGSRHRVANTGGDGVFLRRAAGSNDRIRAWGDNTIFEYQGETVEAQGTSWAKMKDPVGNVGWVPVQYLSPDNSPPPARSAAPAAQPGPPRAAAPAPAGIQTVPVAPAAAAPGVAVQPGARPPGG